jgi:histidinol phosphatase-like PHP family hydrolase
MPAFRLLVLTDIHYDRDLGAELLRRAIEDARARGGFDAIALLGDLLADGESPDAAGLLADLRGQIDQAAPNAPVLVVPGNHDGPPERVLAAFDQRAGLREIGGYRFLTFADRYEYAPFTNAGRPDMAHYCTRRNADLGLPEEVAARPGGPIIALQHNPLWPPIEADYPYMPTNAEAIRNRYGRAGVLASISGHYHPGQELARYEGVHYVTARALGAPPYPYCLVELDDRRVRVQRRRLSTPEELAVWDGHAHTEFAYCGAGTTAATAIDRGRRMGLAGVCLVEHAPQLYVSDEDFWGKRHLDEPESWRRGTSDRMAEYRRFAETLGAGDVRFGFEVELDTAGELTVREEDRRWADLLVGAVHWLRPSPEDLSDANFTELFLRTTTALLARGVDVLAHPLRPLQTAGRPMGPSVYKELAAAMAEHGAAAEINFHNESTPAEFVAECLAQGLKIAFGSDAHVPWEAANFGPHLACLREAAGRDDVGELLWRPPPKAARG